MKMESYIDHTILKPEATKEDIKKLCEEANEYNFVAVCVNPVYVSLAKKYLNGSSVKVATVVGFPLGATTTKSKVEETKKAMEDGADEIDMVMSIGLFKGGEYNEVEKDIQSVVEAAHGKTVKVILETGFLNPLEIKKACELSQKAGAAFVKTSTGFGPRGASLEDIKIMKDTVGDNCLIKASGGIRDAKFANELINAGASRIGTSSGIKIIGENNG